MRPRPAIVVILSLALAELVSSFVLLANTPRQGRRRPRRRQPPQQRQPPTLFGISEWRDLDFQLPGTDRQLGVNSLTGPPKSVCLLPFPYQEVLLQGETKQLRLYEERFIKLFQDVYVHENHGFAITAEGSHYFVYF